jgi:hypothetical protein
MIRSVTRSTISKSVSRVVGGGGGGGEFSPADLLPLFWFTPAGIEASGSGFSRVVTSWADDYGNALTPTASREAFVFESRTNPGLNVYMPVSGDIASMSKSYTNRGFSYFLVCRKRKDWSAQVSTPDRRLGYFGDHTGASSTLASHHSLFSTTSTLGFIASGNPRSTEEFGVSDSWDLIGYTIASDGTIKFFENGRSAVSATATAPEVNPTSFVFGRTSTTVSHIEVVAILAYQSEIAEADVAKLYAYFMKQYNAGSNYNKSYTITGDSIIAGETYIIFNSGNYANTTICERFYLRDRTRRVADMTRSSTFIADGTAVMNSDNTTGNRGGDAIHNSSYAQNIHVIQHGRNDFHVGDSLATVQTAIEAAIDARLSKGQSVWVCTLVDTLHSTVTANYPDQAAFDAAIVSYNSWLRSNYASLGCAGIVDFAANAAFTPGTGAFDDTEFYSTDRVHPNSNGGDLMADIMDEALP